MTHKTYFKKNPVRLKRKAKQKFREQVGKEHNETCDTCKGYAPIYIIGYIDAYEFDLFLCGHVSHIRHHSIGGGDTLDNVRWECKTCHDKRNAWKGG